MQEEKITKKYDELKGEVKGDYFYRGLAFGMHCFDNYNSEFPFWVTIPVEDVGDITIIEPFAIRLEKKGIFFKKTVEIPELVKYDLKRILNLSEKGCVKVTLPNRKHFFVVK